MPLFLWPRVALSRSRSPPPSSPVPEKGHPGLGSTLLGFIKTRSQNVEMYKNGELLPASGCVHAGVWRAGEGGGDVGGRRWAWGGVGGGVGGRGGGGGGVVVHLDTRRSPAACNGNTSGDNNAGRRAGNRG